ncbi:hypothetical protein ACFLYD_04935 [Chloroflexota bacterium]
MDAEALLITFLIFLTVAVLVAYAATSFPVTHTIAMVLVGLGVSVLFDELLRSPSTMDWILAAELREGLEKLSPQEPAAED